MASFKSTSFVQFLSLRIPRFSACLARSLPAISSPCSLRTVIPRSLELLYRKHRSSQIHFPSRPSRFHRSCLSSTIGARYATRRSAPSNLQVLWHLCLLVLGFE